MSNTYVQYGKLIGVQRDAGIEWSYTVRICVDDHAYAESAVAGTEEIVRAIARQYDQPIRVRGKVFEKALGFSGDGNVEYSVLERDLPSLKEAAEELNLVREKLNEMIKVYDGGERGCSIYVSEDGLNVAIDKRNATVTFNNKNDVHRALVEFIAENPGIVLDDLITAKIVVTSLPAFIETMFEVKCEAELR